MENKVYHGQVIFFKPKKGYGFISWEKDGEKQTDIFCHYSDILIDGFKTLQKDQKVSFELGQNKHGELKAVSVQLMN